MKFLHMADMHFDSPFISLTKSGLSDLRRMEQRNVFKKIIEYIIENKIEYFLIAGDLYEHKEIRKSTIEFINSEFKKIPNTKVFIVPGNHDPYIKNSYYDTFIFSSNVHVLKKPLDIYEDEKVRIYGVGFTDFYMNENPLLDNITIKKDEKATILVGHCDVNGAQDNNGLSYNSIPIYKLKELDFDYAALGHIHNKEFQKSEKIAYAGSTISLGFDELGEHGVIIGEIVNHKVKTEFLKMDDRIFTEYELNVDNMNSNEEIIEKSNDLKFKEKELVKLIFVGKRNFNIDTKKILELLENTSIIKIKDCTQRNIDINEIAKQNNLKGLFIKELLSKLENKEINEEDFQTILEIALEAME